jgi:hemolysin activation/secretion protein
MLAMIQPAIAQENDVDSGPDEAAASEPTTFYVGEFRVRGNTLLTPVQIELTLYPFLGEEKSIQDVEAARKALEQRYRDAGFPTAFVDIPEQDVVDGVVFFDVTEGKVQRLTVTGSRYFSLRRIRSKVPALAEGGVPYLPQVESEIGRLNQVTSDRAVTPLLRPGSQPGMLEVELRVNDEPPLHGDITFNNRYSNNTTQQRLSASIRYDNLWQKEHSLSLQYQTSPQDTDEVKVLAGTYLWRFENTDNLLALYAVHSKSQTAALESLTVLGDGDVVGVRSILPMDPLQNYFHSFSVGLDFKDFNEGLDALGADNPQTTPVDYLSFAGQYNATRRAANSPSLTRFGVGMNFNISGISDDDIPCERLADLDNDGIAESIVTESLHEFTCKRANAKTNYYYLTGNIERRQDLGWHGTSLRITLDGQLADSALISNEQFAAGGVTSVRGYPESHALGDMGVAGSIEFVTPSFHKYLDDHLQNLTFHLFADGAKVKLLDPLPSDDPQAELYSAGFGFRLTAWKHLEVSGDLAEPLHTNGTVEEKDTRGHFEFKYVF